jgi:hypothetical protein
MALETYMLGSTGKSRALLAMYLLLEDLVLVRSCELLGRYDLFSSSTDIHRKRPRFSTILRIAEALGVDPSELVDRE